MHRSLFHSFVPYICREGGNFHNKMCPHIFQPWHPWNSQKSDSSKRIYNTRTSLLFFSISNHFQVRLAWILILNSVRLPLGKIIQFTKTSFKKFYLHRIIDIHERWTNIHNKVFLLRKRQNHWFFLMSFWSQWLYFLACEKKEYIFY